MAAAFDSLYRQGFVRVALGIPEVRVADPTFNAEQMLGLAQRASADHAALCVFPELGVSCYSAEDLFHQDALLDAVHGGAGRAGPADRGYAPAWLSSAPRCGFGTGCSTARWCCTAAGCLAWSPRATCRATGSSTRKRQFAAARDAAVDEVLVAGQAAPFGADLIFEATDVAHLAIHVEICEDLWVPTPPSSVAALAGAHGAGEPVRVQHHGRQGRLP